MGLLLVHISAAVLNSDTTTVCSLVDENTFAALSCPPGMVIAGFQFATFGTFQANSSCGTELIPLPTCPVTVTAQANRLCVGSNTCNLSCDCVSLPNPCGCNSNAPSLANVVLRLAFPTVPCPNVPKQLGLIATCQAALPSPAPQPAPSNPVPTNLQLEFMASPVLGLDDLKPHFSWTPPASTSRLSPFEVQSAARIIVSSYPGNTVIWDSGVLNTTVPIIIPSSPLPLVADSRYQWSVMVQANNSGVWSPSSALARFNTGLLSPSDWSGANWIGGWRPGTLMRKDFTVVSTGTPTYISVFVSACQYYLLYLDGVRIGQRELDVAWTRFQYFRSYASYDLDPSLFTPGEHTIGMALGQGFCGESLGKAGNHSTQGLLRLSLYASDGSLLQPSIVTDLTWTTGSGPVLTDSTYYGEQYNASMEQPGWASPGFVPPSGAPAWTPAVYTNDPPTPPLMTSQLMPAIERMGTISPLSITTVNTTENNPSWTFDFGQEIAGRTLLTIPSGIPKGTNFTIKHTEAMGHPPYATYDGTAWMGNLFWAYPVDSYISSGAVNGESYEPAFTEHGFRYAQLFTDPPLQTPPTTSMLTAVILRTAAREQTQLIFGNPLLQGISNNSWWTEAAALMGIPAGAAARGERTGWTGDASAASESELVDFDTGAFFTQFLQQLQQLQCADGTVSSCIPNTDPERDGPPAPLPCMNEEADPSWGTVYPTILWGVWKYYGAIGVAAQHYPSLQMYIDMLETRINTTGLGQLFCAYGDWNPVVRTDCHITAAASYLHDLEHMIEIATALGNTADATMYSTRLAIRRTEYHTAFWNPTIGLYGAGTQAAQAVALWTGVAANANVAGNVSVWLGQAMGFNGSLTFGFLGVRYAFEALALNGQIEAALRCLLQTAYPSYGFELYNLYEPSTSLWETWDADTHTQWLDESSRDHHYQASINSFLRKYVAGLDMPTGASAWSSIIIRSYASLPLAPDLADALPFARATVQAYKGTIEVSWLRQTNGLQLNATLPSGTSGTVSVPLTFGSTTVCRESGILVWNNGAFVPGVAGISSGMISSDGKFITFTVTSGAFLFTTTAT